MFHLQEHLVGNARLTLRIRFFQIPTDHQFDQFVDMGVGRFNSCNLLPIPQDRDAIRESKNLIHTVCNVDDRNPRSFELFDDKMQCLGLGLSQGGRRLVHDEQPGILGHGLGDLNQLLVAHAQSSHQGCGINFNVKLLEDFRGLGFHLSPVNHDPLARRSSEKDVFRHRKFIHQIELLIDHAYPHAL